MSVPGSVYMSVIEVARMLGVHESTVRRRWISRRKGGEPHPYYLSPDREGKVVFRRSEVEEFFRSQESA